MRPTTTRGRWALILAIGTAATFALTGAATLTADERPWATFVIVAACVAPVLYGGAWALIPDPAAPDLVTDPESSIEHGWVRSAGFGSWCDLITALGLVTAAQSLFDADPVPLPVFLVLGMAGFGIRYWAASRRAA